MRNNRISDERHNLQVRGPRAAALALQALQERHGVVVSYEDPVYLKEHGAPSFLSKLERPEVPGLADWVRVPQTAAIDVDYIVDPSGAPVGIRSIVEDVLTKFNAQDVAGELDCEEVGPRLVALGAPRLPELRPLDFNIVVAQRLWDGSALLKRIIRLVARETGLKVFLGMAPTNLLAQRLEFGGEATARELLHEALDKLAGEGRAGYDAYFDAGLEWFMINIKASQIEEEGPIECPDGDKPGGETSKIAAQKDSDYIWEFDVFLKAGGKDFTGRTIKEWPGKVCDACWFPGSGCNQFSVGKATWTVQSGNEYGYDPVGIYCKCKDLYMAYRNDQPCAIKAEQIMTIQTGNDWCHYATNCLEMDVSKDEVAVKRGATGKPIRNQKCP